MDQWDLWQESANCFKNGYFGIFKYDFCIQFFNACQTISFAWSIERKRPTNVSTKYTGCSNWILDAFFKWLKWLSDVSDVNILKTHFTEPLQNLWSFYAISNRIFDLDGKVWNKRIACLKMSHFKSIVIRCGNLSHKCYFTAEKRLASQNATLDLWRSQQGNNLSVCSTEEW